MSKAAIKIIIVLALLLVQQGIADTEQITGNAATGGQAAEVQSGSPYDRIALREKTDAFMAIGDFAAALNEYAHLSRKHASDMYLRNEYARLKEFIDLRKKLNGTIPDGKWPEYKAKLRAYMYSRGLFYLALELDSKAWEKYPSEQQREQLLETLLILDKNQQAMALTVEQAADLSSDSDRWRSLNLLLAARTGEISSVLAKYDDLTFDLKEKPLCQFDLARIMALAGDDRWEDILAEFLAEQPTGDWQALKSMMVSATEFTPYRQGKTYLSIVAEIDKRILFLHSCYKTECPKERLQEPVR
ncbi:MAG: hypothetical protein JW745_10250 [Sedimentisphaerales bacterium]|nr:hypothetical protein [Sedimentisphaerales bacterium]MBN2844152.1 hypothetical protein [Sedimentisphaerales bacterium]